MLKATADE
ncbi:hypothetical protein D039_2305A, partial [Vibrio parahaemolyticus EKP-028]